MTSGASSADTTPAAFDFQDVTVGDRQTVHSNTVKVAGIDEPTSIALSGTASGRFQVNGGAWQSGSATVDAGDEIRLRLVSRAMGDPGARRVTLDIGGVAGEWRVTTTAADIPPPANKVFDLGGTTPGAPCGGKVRCVSAGQSIQAAIDAANGGDTIQVAAGTYDANLRIEGKTIRLLGGFPAAGGFASRNPLSNPTILRSTGGDATVTLEAARSSVVDGFRIRNGTGSAVYGGEGGGVFVHGGNVRVSNNIVADNVVCGPPEGECRGGGIYVLDGGNVVIAGNIVRDNRAARGAGIATNGIGPADTTITIRDNLVEGNRATSDHGGGLYVFGNLRILRNIVRANSVGLDVGYGWGGGILVVEAGGVAHLEHNRVTDNLAPSLGSGVFVDEGATANLNGDLIYDNACGVTGSGVYVDGSYDGRGSVVNLNNVTVADHDCEGNGHGLYAEGASKVVVTNGIFHRNGGTDATYCADPGTQGCEGSQPTKLSIRYTLIDDFPGMGNFSANPRFVDRNGGNYRLAPGSPAIDTADPASSVAYEPAPNGGRRDLGSYGGTRKATPSP
ncbi:MAG TPA: right-handed parallel beta-helix repeat-containing protein [Nevskiaceae bacterium]|nr:right-handed parallel beta-helix repeat-containing protein [Nevskiaceae bacterium]